MWSMETTAPPAYGTLIERSVSGRFVVVANGSGGSTTITTEEYEAMHGIGRAFPGTIVETPRQRPAERPLAKPEGPATPRQFSFLRKLLGERSGNAEAQRIREAMNAMREAGCFDKQAADDAIKALMALPKD